MAVKSKTSEVKPGSFDEFKMKALLASDELLTQAQDNIQKVLDDSESKKIAVSLKIDRDDSESEPLVTVSIRFSEAYTDKRVARLNDPNQKTLFHDKSELEPAEGEVNPGDKEEGGD